MSEVCSAKQFMDEVVESFSDSDSESPNIKNQCLKSIEYSKDEIDLINNKIPPPLPLVDDNTNYTEPKNRLKVLILFTLLDSKNG